MCGIFGIVYAEERDELGQVLVQAGRRLSYRGYDSVGCAAVGPDAIELRKDVGKVDEVDARYRLSAMSGMRGITQLRWATFGRPSKVNAQPHFDCDEDMVGAHNGNVVNAPELKERLKAEGHIVRGDNDGEIVVHVLEKYYDLKRDFDMAVMLAARDLKGDYAYVVTHRDENVLYAAKNGSSLYVGVGEGFTCCSSDLPSILDLTRHIVVLEDGEYVMLRPDSYEIRSVVDGSVVRREPQVTPFSVENAEKGGFAHFMEKEIFEQPQKIRGLVEYCRESGRPASFLEMLRGCKGRIYLVGAGSSYHACLYGAYMFQRMTGRCVLAVRAGEFNELHLPAAGPDDAVVLVSQSGETKDVINVLNACSAKGLENLSAIVNVPGSTLYNRVEARLPLVCDLEISVPATKTLMNEMALLAWLAGAMAAAEAGGRRGHPLEPALVALPSLLEDTIDACGGSMERLAHELCGAGRLFCLAYSFMYPVAREAALKIKEVVYHHCEGMYSSEFKHGPLAIIEDGHPVLFFGHSSHSSMLVSHMNEISCRGGRIICIADEDNALRMNSDDFTCMPPVEPSLAPLTALVPAQLLAYHMCVCKGYDPDYPRNLSKTITVD